ncbi:unnamed protein product [Calypogeia fissa]
MDEVVTRCRQQLTSFRIRELKDVLSRLGLPKQGKKQVLMDKIMGVLVPPEKPAVSLKGVGRGNKNAVTREECVTVIDDIYRKLRGEGAPDLASAGKRDAGAGSSSVARSDEPDEASNWGEAKTRCPCGNSKDQGVMIQCDDSKCGVWQHISCVVIPEKPVEEPEVPSQFYCELCRINRSDPFCVTLQSPMPAAKLSSNGAKTEGTNPLQNVEKTFTLSPADRDLLRKPNHDLQVWCVLLNDKVPFRIHWPAYADLRVNGVSVRVTNRPGQQLLGANGRDEGPGIANFTREGLNRISFSAYDARPFVLGVRIMRRNTLQQIFEMIPDVSAGEDFDEALARVRRCINGGGQETADEGDDSDLEVVADSISVNLRCPMSGSRIKVAGRFKPCLHMGCFDLHTFVELNQRARKWQCPICLKNYSLENLIIDPFVSRVTTALKNHPEDVTEVEMKADGHWRPKIEGEKSREPWRSPDGSIVTANGNAKESRVSVPLAAVKVEEGVSSQERGSLRIGMKRSHDGLWAINGNAKRLNGWASNNVAGPSEKAKPTVPAVEAVVISRSTSATDSNEENGEDGERSVNQEPSKEDVEVARYFDDTEVSYPPKDPNKGASWLSGRASESQTPADVIVLSDSDEEEGDNVGFNATSNSGYVRSHTMSVQVSARPVGPLSLSMDAQEASEDPVLVNIPQPFSHVNSTTATQGPTSTLENRGSAGGVMGLPLETTHFWNSSQIRPTVPFNYFPSSSELPTAASVQNNPPIRPTAVQAAPTQVFGVSTHHHRETVPRGWKFGRSPTPSYSNSDCNGVGSDGGNGASSPRESPLQLFLPHQPARAQVQPSLREPHLVDDVDNSWFSLSLGGNDRSVDPVPKRSNHRTSQSKGCGLDSLAASEVLLGMNTNGNHAPSADNRSRMQGSPPYLSQVNSLSPAATSPPFGRNTRMSPIRGSPPRGHQHRSPMQLHRPRHYFRVDSDSD